MKYLFLAKISDIEEKILLSSSKSVSTVREDEIWQLEPEGELINFERAEDRYKRRRIRGKSKKKGWIKNKGRKLSLIYP